MNLSPHTTTVYNSLLHTSLPHNSELAGLILKRSHGKQGSLWESLDEGAKTRALDREHSREFHTASSVHMPLVGQPSALGEASSKDWTIVESAPLFPRKTFYPLAQVSLTTVPLAKKRLDAQSWVASDWETVGQFTGGPWVLGFLESCQEMIFRA